VREVALVIYEPSLTAIVIFVAFVLVTLGLSWWLGRKTRSAAGYFAAHGQIPWFVNGIAFAGDYLSAASFLGICGMIAFYGYDGFLYSIGYLAGWVVALFVIAEPIKRLGKFTFADALDSSFSSRGIRLAAAVSTLAVSLFYLIPQMVGAGALITPLLGFPHYVGVLLVGVVVVLIVVTAGMVSTTWVQFIKGSLLVLFSAILTGLILLRGLNVYQQEYRYAGMKGPWSAEQWLAKEQENATVMPVTGGWQGRPYLRLKYTKSNYVATFRKIATGDPKQTFELRSCQTLTVTARKERLVNGLPQGQGDTPNDFRPVGRVKALDDDYVTYRWSCHAGDPSGDVDILAEWGTGPLSPLAFLGAIQTSQVILWDSEVIREEDGSVTTVYYPKTTSGADVLRPGNHPSLKGIRGDAIAPKLNFLSLMLALFCGTASLPHILIRYYTVKDQSAARKSTVVGIGAIGTFYILTLFLGLGAMTSGALDVTNSNMAAPLLARSFGDLLFAVISAIAFTTVLGTVSGLIVASTGAVVHDLFSGVLRWDLNDYNKVRLAKIAAVGVGAVAMVLGILFQRMNVNFLVGWAFSVAASANLPALVMLLFWKRTTRQGIIAAILVGMTASLAWILLSSDTYRDVYGLPAEDALVPFSQPGIVTIPLGFVVLVGVSLFTQPRRVTDRED
jgi:cation/acetate symporter